MYLERNGKELKNQERGQLLYKKWNKMLFSIVGLFVGIR